MIIYTQPGISQQKNKEVIRIVFIIQKMIGAIYICLCFFYIGLLFRLEQAND